MGLQVQYSLLDRRPENFMIPYCREQGIKLLPYGTVAGGFLSERYLGLPASKCAPLFEPAEGSTDTPVSAW